MSIDLPQIATAVLATYALATGSFAALAVAVLLTTFTLKITFRGRR